MRKKFPFSSFKSKSILHLCYSDLINHTRAVKSEPDFISCFKLPLYRDYSWQLSNVNYYLLGEVCAAHRERRYDDEASSFHRMRSRLSAPCSGSIVNHEYVSRASAFFFSISTLLQHFVEEVKAVTIIFIESYIIFFLIRMQINRDKRHRVKYHFLEKNSSVFGTFSKLVLNLGARVTHYARPCQYNQELMSR